VTGIKDKYFPKYADHPCQREGGGGTAIPPALDSVVFCYPQKRIVLHRADKPPDGLLQEYGEFFGIS
jgi:hypothetical protein